MFKKFIKQLLTIARDMLSELGKILRKSIHEKKDSLKNSSDVFTKHETEIPPLGAKSITIEVKNLTDKPLKFVAIMTWVAITGKQEP